jgi:hypothetical protein
LYFSEKPKRDSFEVVDGDKALATAGVSIPLLPPPFYLKSGGFNRPLRLKIVFDLPYRMKIISEFSETLL